MWLQENGKRLLVANLVAFAVQAVLFGLLSALGVDTMLNALAAKAASWLSFAGQAFWPVLKRVLFGF